ncbi:MAG: secretin and TonB N-terminal domain-containing protein [Phycisphaerales bacterium]|nr:secretin and TonB N-terminal domain-containing protein [Phycisphaerales bacterium]
MTDCHATTGRNRAAFAAMTQVAPAPSPRSLFPLGSLRAYGLACAACVGLVTPALGQIDLDSWAQTPPAQPARSSGNVEEELEGQVEVSAYSTVDIHVQNTDLAKVLQMLSIQSQRNIIVSKNVSGTVSADLYDVTFFEALDAILNSNGYGYVEEGSFIKVYTLEELRAIKEAAKQLVYRRFELSYLNAADASVFVTPLLSEKGTIAVSAEVAPGFKPDESDGGGENWASYATMVVHDFPENVEEIARLITELDIRPQQVQVEATVLQSTLNEDNAFGIDWSLLADVDFLDFTNPLSTVDNLLSGAGESGFQPPDNKATAVRSNVGQTQRAGGLKVGIISDDISIFLRVLDEVTDTTVLSRPRVLAVNRNRGQILIGRRIGYLSTTSTETSTTQTVQFLDTGTQLIFRPFVGKDGYIRMELKPSVSEGIIRDVTGSDGSTFTIPDQITQELQTNVVVKDGNTIVLGGLFREETTLTRRQVPFLGDIPIIGAAFKGKEDITRRSEITFLITPSIMRDEVLISEGQRANEMVEDARLGGRNGVLPWSNDRLTNGYNLKAEEAIAAGDSELALYYIDLSLSLKRTQPQVIQMRERLLGKSERWFNGSIMRNLSNEHIDASLNQMNGPSQGGETTASPATDPLLPTTGAAKTGGSTGGATTAGATTGPQAVPASTTTTGATALPTTEPTKAPTATPAGGATPSPKTENEISWGGADNGRTEMSDCWFEYGLSTWQDETGVWNIDENAFTNPALLPPLAGDPCAPGTRTPEQQNDFALQAAEQNLRLGQSVALSLSVTPMGALHFGPALARYQAWVAAQQSGQPALPGEESGSVLVEVPTDTVPSK